VKFSVNGNGKGGGGGKKTGDRADGKKIFIGKGQNFTRPPRGLSLRPSWGFLFWLLHGCLIQKPQVNMEVVSPNSCFLK
jgi:hypothetical protein